VCRCASQTLASYTSCIVSSKCYFCLAMTKTNHDAPVQIGLRVSRSLGEKLAAIAERENNGVSAVVRRLLAEALQRESVKDTEAVA
jgi:hypothetical protein